MANWGQARPMAIASSRVNREGRLGLAGKREDRQGRLSTASCTCLSCVILSLPTASKGHVPIAGQSSLSFQSAGQSPLGKADSDDLYHLLKYHQRKSLRMITPTTFLRESRNQQ
ncbi:hypothetical protein PAHAL_9G228000 [Panicum hallii]|uniref:Uncharacterized protein n=1 Tax=Panicum hallii TaxID=206008 RepID=A0A2S3ILM8_9POAL|nr:hypothetical protein PAHAL_9G228000 [Panicum hallii]